MIEDHGIETTGSLIGKEEKGIVLDITKERLLHLYGDQQNLTVQLTREGGVLVKIRVPFREMNIESEGTLVVESAL